MSKDLIQKEWDAIVVGTGMGGGTIGRRLAENGLQVLFVEKGPMGWDLEQQGMDQNLKDPEARLSRGLWPSPIKAIVDGKVMEKPAYLGAGVGGSSVFYAAALERFEPHDMDNLKGVPHPTNGWPVGYKEFVPYYSQAEELYAVCGTQNPLACDNLSSLRQPPPNAPIDDSLMDSLKKSGKNPYRLHVAIKYDKNCMECIGEKCPRSCKMDSKSAGVMPALETGNAAILDKCDVQSLRGDGKKVTHLEAEWNGQKIELKGKQIIIAAGGFSSPRLLLASTAPEWKDGCANESGLVGKNLMFHAHEFMAIWPAKEAAFGKPVKTIGMRDLYYKDGNRYGLFHSMGMEVSYGNILTYLQEGYDESFLQNIKSLRQFLRIPAVIASKLFGKAKLFSALCEDFPYEENQVLLDKDDPTKILFKYHVHNEFKKRHKTYRRELRKLVKPLRSLFLNRDLSLNFGHPCGTLRFGTDPNTSVLNTDCRAHSVDNLYVVDSSFMPTSGGVNPSLTIAANALRVGDIIVARHQR